MQIIYYVSRTSGCSWIFRLYVYLLQGKERSWQDLLSGSARGFRYGVSPILDKAIFHQWYIQLLPHKPHFVPKHILLYCHIVGGFIHYIIMSLF